MNPEEITFEEFFTERLKHKGFTLKKAAEVTGISPRNLQDLATGDFSHLPSAPYVRGYVIKLGKVLEFDGEAWWQRMKAEGNVKNSGLSDALPHNRFLKRSPLKLILGCVAGAIVLLYFIIQFPIIVGRPTVALTYPATTPFATTGNLITLQGKASNADSLSVNGEGVAIATDGTWQKNVLLQSGSNTFTVSAKKFLGGTSNITETIIYTPPVTVGNPPATTTTPTTTHAGVTAPTSSATGNSSSSL